MMKMEIQLSGLQKLIIQNTEKRIKQHEKDIVDYVTSDSFHAQWNGKGKRNE